MQNKDGVSFLMATKIGRRTLNVGWEWKRTEEKRNSISCFEYELFVMWKQSNDCDKFVCFRRHYFIRRFFPSYQMGIQIRWNFFFLFIQALVAARVVQSVVMDLLLFIAHSLLPTMALSSTAVAQPLCAF